MSTQWGSSVKPEMLTRDEATKQGFTVHMTPKGLLGIKGPFHAPTAVVKVTENEVSK